MSEFKGTRGPWKAVYNCDWEDGANATSIYSSDEVYVADVYRGYVGSEDLTEDEQKANARLIAAAPELLEALQDAVDQLKFNLTLLRCDDEFIDIMTKNARHVIAKVIGEE